MREGTFFVLCNLIGISVKNVVYLNCMSIYGGFMNKDIFDRIMEWKFLRIFNPFYKKI